MLVSIASAVTFANITNLYSKNVSVIDAATNTTTATVNIGNIPFGVQLPLMEQKYMWKTAVMTLSL